MTPADTLTRAAELLEELAEDIWSANQVNDEWGPYTEHERAQHEELYEIADALRRMAA